MKEVKPSAYELGKSKVKKAFGSSFILMGLISTGIAAPDTGVIPGLKDGKGNVMTEAQQHAANRNKSKIAFAGNMIFDISSNTSSDYLLVFEKGNTNSVIDYSPLGTNVVGILGVSTKVAGQWVSQVVPNGAKPEEIITIVVNGGSISVDQAVAHIVKSSPYVSDIKMVANTDSDTVQFTKTFGYIEQPTGQSAMAYPLNSIIKNANPNSKDAADTRWFVPNPQYPTDKSGKEWNAYRDFYFVHGAGLGYSLTFNTPIHRHTA